MLEILLSCLLTFFLNLVLFEWRLRRKMLQSDSERKKHFYRDAYAIYEKLLLPYSFPGMMRWKTENPDLIKSVYQQLVKKMENHPFVTRRERRFIQALSESPKFQKKFFILIQRLYYRYHLSERSVSPLLPGVDVWGSIREECRGQWKELGLWKSMWRTLHVTLFYIDPWLTRITYTFLVLVSLMLLWSIHGSMKISTH
ncbi:hypothetical protein FY534_07740 [Alicyclobacillus sp. TC]|uniref:Uncharacterized protein n=1 Tax=Alicyclobacillus tolerans TaxID=90970 RepID=A0ABT9LZB0_9BACL|nr:MULTISPECIES: hypothetical protein [Alicyclobacillus]MDP9729608.1 hypothetical protein [Alicyclobacillus tengchongensis]QRF23573.1 hypothetical protein FY534_07740 [Alicyclobacillus sp. TC]